MWKDWFPNFSATLIRKICDLSGGRDRSMEAEHYTSEYEEEVRRRVQDVLEGAGFPSVPSMNFMLPPQGKRLLEDFRDQSKTFFELQVLLCWMEMWYPIDDVFSDYKDSSFHCINTNFEETGVCILPKGSAVTTLRTVIGKSSKSPRKTARELTSLAGRLVNIDYVYRSELGGICLENVVLPLDQKGNPPSVISIAATPLLSGSRKDVLHYDPVVTRNEEGEKRFFDNVLLLKEAEANKRMAAAFRAARRYHADILIGPEICGTKVMYQVDENGYNNFFAALGAEADGLGGPSLIIAPSYCNNHRNYVHMYSHEGKLLARQDKFYPYVFTEKDGKRYGEALKPPPKYVSLIHVPGWGRIAVAICVDALYPDYRRLLVDILGVRLLLIPSFTPGLSNFEEVLSSKMEFGCTVVWLNCCAAKDWKPEEGTPYVGAACSPSISSHSPVVRLHTKCSGQCREECIFLIKIPLDCGGENPREDVRIQCEQL